jgi:hypothetical protein
MGKRSCEEGRWDGWEKEMKRGKCEERRWEVGKRKEVEKEDARKEYERVWEKEVEKVMWGKELRERSSWKREDGRKGDKMGRVKGKEDVKERRRDEFEKRRY